MTETELNFVTKQQKVIDRLLAALETMAEHMKRMTLILETMNNASKRS